MKLKKIKFFKLFSFVIISSLFLSITAYSTVAVSSKEQRLKSYDELKQIYMKILGTESTTRDPYLYTMNEDVVVAAPEFAPAPAEAPQASMAMNTTSSASAVSVSSTNTQVAGVDEGDIVKTDGNYIYAVSNINGNKVNIISTLRKGSVKVVGSIKLNGYPLEMYLKGNRLVMITNQDMYFDTVNNKYVTSSEYQKASDNFYKNYSKNTQTMNYDFYRRYIYRSMVQAYIYDVTNPSAPKNIRIVQQDGYYLSSRLVGDQLYMVTNNSNYWLQYQKASDININAIVPQYSDTAYGIKNKLLLPQSICMFPNVNVFSYTVVSGFNVSTNSKVTCEAVLGGGSNIYASVNNLYVMYENYNVGVVPVPAAGSKVVAPSISETNIIKYSLANGVPKVSAFGTVPGSILNQFSVDEYNSNFRIATTTGNTWDGSTNNNVYVLNSSLSVVGKIENLAPGEKIYSVRFMDKKGYVVTFRQVDPLFALDLSNPSAPKVTGQLKIPGFSSYLHPYSENILIGIGNTTTETIYGATVTNGLKLSLFDVSNPFAPKEIQSYTLGSRGTYSEVLNNHKALLFSKEKNIIGFPVQLYENKSGSQDSSYGTLTYLGYYVFSIDPASGFKLQGRVTHLKDGTDPNYSWGSGLTINRGVFVDNTLYTISDKLVKANSLKDFTLQQQVNLP